MGLIPKLENEFEKCEYYSMAIIMRKPFKSVDRNTELLELTHFDIYKFKNILTHGGNRYFIIFINNFSKYS